MTSGFDHCRVLITPRYLEIPTSFDHKMINEIAIAEAIINLKI